MLEGKHLPSQEKAFTTYFNRYMDILVPVIQKGIDSGEFRPGDAYEIALAMGAIMEGTLLLWVYDSSMVEPEKHIRSGMKLLLDGVLVPT